MKFLATGRSVWLAGWALPTLAVLCCAPSVARAGCGDYVVTRLGHGGEAAAMGQQQHPADAPAQPHRPCNGPHCSQAPVVPPLAPPTVPPPAPSSEWGCLAADLTLPAPGRGAVLFDRSTHHPVRNPSGIFHPPRRAA